MLPLKGWNPNLPHLVAGTRASHFLFTGPDSPVRGCRAFRCRAQGGGGRACIAKILHMDSLPVPPALTSINTYARLYAPVSRPFRVEMAAGNTQMR